MKNPVKSKTSWVAAITLTAGFLTDPTIIGIVPPDWAPMILKVCGAVTFIISTFFTKRAEEPLNIP